MSDVPMIFDCGSNLPILLALAHPSLQIGPLALLKTQNPILTVADSVWAKRYHEKNTTRESREEQMIDIVTQDVAV